MIFFEFYEHGFMFFSTLVLILNMGFCRILMLFSFIKYFAYLCVMDFLSSCPCVLVNVETIICIQLIS